MNDFREPIDIAVYEEATRDGLKEIHRLDAEIVALKAERDALRYFVQKICAGYLGVGEEIGDIDGATIQEWAAEVGLLKATPVSEPCGEGCVCAEVYTPGESWECYRPTRLLTGEPEKGK